MPRYFIEVAYMGTRYSGFQVQQNGNTIQTEVSRALKIFFGQEFELTGSSRTDAGVHAKQNFFHFDADAEISNKAVYSLNAILPYDIVVKNIIEVKPEAHCRFDATSRTYHYYITRFKNPFYFNRAYYYPFKADINLLQELATSITTFNDFTSFSKKKTQVKTFRCHIEYSRWVFEDDIWRYEVKADRFLRGMVKGLAGTMLKLSKHDKTIADLSDIFEAQDPAAADFSVSPDGLFLMSVEFKNAIFHNLG
ncbi:tRNA pseudouridine(38-40) synthase TruA [Parafilimonas sp.]|uniref:tRNA pseudouridine(38-40) synthase TruA n=1 Tax=Parafilimonas sp. TaxID=1969739 RepID=UPI0039E4A964